MQQNLTHALAVFTRWLESRADTGAVISGPAMQMLGEEFRRLLDRAAELEQQERQLAQMEAVAADLDVMARDGYRRFALLAAATMEPGTNVVLFPGATGGAP